MTEAGLSSIINVIYEWAISGFGWLCRLFEDLDKLVSTSNRPATIFESKKELISQHILTIHAYYWVPDTQESWKFKILVLHYCPE
ncbi:hypothetical protein N7516_000817 [Penicillium verrucosum]|uniref:uncharacterized protein n=1 Tax=Penicillium verrucosum TaxID=60171 RepID=UPI002545516A|nr:uncharacterized protein N7516_000817 [Penicillium verrucosum]KAJ5940649.1 hypothetical protein N7516_000817 [Penicillium verrucosum]